MKCLGMSECGLLSPPPPKTVKNEFPLQTIPAGNSSRKPLPVVSIPHISTSRELERGGGGSRWGGTNSSKNQKPDLNWIMWEKQNMASTLTLLDLERQKKINKVCSQHYFDNENKLDSFQPAGIKEDFKRFPCVCVHSPVSHQSV